MKIDPAKLAVIRDVLIEMGVEVQTDEQVVAGLELVAAVVVNARATERLRRFNYEWLRNVPT